MTLIKMIGPLGNSKGIMSRNLKASSQPEEEEHLRKHSGTFCPHPGLLAVVVTDRDGTQQCFMRAQE